LIKHLPVNEKGRDFVVGDLHGCWHLLKALLDHVNFDPTNDRLISVGDLIDRGPENLKCLELLDESSWFHCVKGNHEEMMALAVSGETSPTMWQSNGGAWIFEHMTPTGLTPEMLDTAELLGELPLLITVDMRDGRRFHVIHSELKADRPITDADLADEVRFAELTGLYHANILWGRTLFYPLCIEDPTHHRLEKFRRKCELDKLDVMFGPELSRIYSGHTVVQRVITYKGQTNIDTGAYFTLERYGSRKWAGLTLTEPLTGKFWQARPDGVTEVEALEV
jgi:serine/threonine protein phosphatase 1